MGGENSVWKTAAACLIGSSPRGRGKLNRRRHGQGGLGLIPAWAGKTGALEGGHVCVPAHPRVGGENHEVQSVRAVDPGSSPRGRGKPRSSVRSGVAWGLIPAWAGKTWPFHVHMVTAGAHPRVGGENIVRSFRSIGRAGSSPRGRGKRRFQVSAWSVVRLIPAWAGKTSRTSVSHAAPRAHPRVGGENAIIAPSRRASSGSSPRGRGKHTPHD